MKTFNGQEELVQWLDAIGVSAVAYQRDEKGPRKDKWQVPVPNSEKKFFKRNGEQLNIGFLMGDPSKGLVDFDLDFDDWEMMSRAVAVLDKYNPVWVGRGGWYRHALFRYGQRWKTDQKSIRTAKHESAGHIEWRRGGTKEGGENKGAQSFMMGVHPRTGEELEFMDGTFPEDEDDIILYSWEKLNEIWEELKTVLDLDEGKRYDPLVSKSRERTRPLSAGVTLATLITQLTGASVRSGGGNVCPFCFDVGEQSADVDVCWLSDDLQYGACHHGSTCPANVDNFSGGEDNIFVTAHVIAFHLGLDPVLDDECIREAMDYLEDGHVLRPHGEFYSWCEEWDEVCSAGGETAVMSGVEGQADEKLQQPKKSKKKKEKKKDELKEAALEALLGTAKVAAGRFLFLWGKWYEREDERWLPQDELIVAEKLRKMHPDVVGSYHLRYLLERAREECSPAAADGLLVAAEDRGNPIELQTGVVLERTSFVDATIELDDRFDTVQVFDRTREEFFPAESPLKYPEDVRGIEDAKIFMAFISDMLGYSTGEISYEEFMKRVQIVLGVIGGAICDNRFQKIVVLLGKGGRGKDTLFNIVHAIVGASSATAQSLDSLLRDMFATTELLGKKIVYLGEMEQKPRGKFQQDQYANKMDMLKRIAGQSLVRSRQMHKQGVPPFRPKCSVWISANDLKSLPSDGGDPDAWRRRLIVIECASRQRDDFRPNPYLVNNMKSEGELRIVAGCAIDAYWRVVKCGGDFGSAEAWERAKESLAASEVEEFLAEFEQGDENDFIAGEDIVDWWNQLYIERALDYKKPAEAYEVLQGRFRGVSTVRKREDGLQKRGLSCLKWKE